MVVTVYIYGKGLCGSICDDDCTGLIRQTRYPSSTVVAVPIYGKALCGSICDDDCTGLIR